MRTAHQNSHPKYDMICKRGIITCPAPRCTAITSPNQQQTRAPLAHCSESRKPTARSRQHALDNCAC